MSDKPRLYGIPAVKERPPIIFTGPKQCAECQNETMRAEYAVARIQLDEVSRVLGRERMANAQGVHYEAVQDLLDERDKFARACVAQSEELAKLRRGEKQ